MTKMVAEYHHVWKDHEIHTIGELFDALAALESSEEGTQFMEIYRAVNEHADANVGYVAGYGSEETRKRILTFTRTAHPFLGNQ